MEAEAAEAGFHKKSGYHGNPHAVCWSIQCCRCDTKFEAGWGVRTPPDMMIKNMRRKGWDVGYGQAPLCPHHARTHNPAPLGRPGNSRANGPPQGQKPPPPPAPPATIIELTPKESPMSPAAIPQNPQLARRLFAELEEHFDVQTGRYRNAMSDDKIASNTGLAVDLVIATREEAFGPLAEDPAIAKLRDDIELNQMEFDEFRVRHERNQADLKRRLESLQDQRKLGRR